MLSNQEFARIEMGLEHARKSRPGTPILEDMWKVVNECRRLKIEVRPDEWVSPLVHQRTLQERDDARSEVHRLIRDLDNARAEAHNAKLFEAEIRRLRAAIKTHEEMREAEMAGVTTADLALWRSIESDG